MISAPCERRCSSLHDASDNQIIHYLIYILHSHRILYFPYTTLFRSPFYTPDLSRPAFAKDWLRSQAVRMTWQVSPRNKVRSEEHTSELQSPYDLVCRLLLEKKKCRSR